jgi:predicted Rossmann-fold nucleotide-binding protein
VISQQLRNGFAHEAIQPAILDFVKNQTRSAFVPKSTGVAPNSPAPATQIGANRLVGDCSRRDLGTGRDWTGMRALFTPVALFDGFDPDEVGSYVDTYDFQTYLSTKRSSTPRHRVRWAEQDAEITEARDAFLGDARSVAIMGGHKVARNEPTYRIVAELARTLTRSGAIVSSGGGPGAMEATHLGAMLSAHSNVVLTDSITHLASAPEFPSGMGHVVRPDGSVDHDLVDALHHWQAPAFTLLADLAGGGALTSSLSVPTWFYGHEPPTPFATHIAKYVGNAVREDGLLAIAKHGVVYAPGGAGTLQEVFQDAAQNAYRTQRWFSPMCFLDLPFQGIDRWWTERYPIESFLRPLFGDADYDNYVRISTDANELAEFLALFIPTPG